MQIENITKVKTVKSLAKPKANPTIERAITPPPMIEPHIALIQIGKWPSIDRKATGIAPMHTRNSTTETIIATIAG